MVFTKMKLILKVANGQYSCNDDDNIQESHNSVTDM